MRSLIRAGYALVIGAILVATAVMSVQAVITSGAFAEAAPGLGKPLAAPIETPAEALALEQESVKITASFQVSQPRDPFRPLITPDSPIGDVPGVGGIPGTGGQVDDDDFQPSGTTVTLVEIRVVAGVSRATVEVNGVEYDVGVGETFAGSYKVVSLTASSGVFTFGDKAFELSVGQQILK